MTFETRNEEEKRTFEHSRWDRDLVRQYAKLLAEDGEGQKNVEKVDNIGRTRMFLGLTPLLLMDGH